MIDQSIIEKHWYKLKDICRGYAFKYKIDINDLFSLVLEKMCKTNYVDNGHHNSFYKWSHTVIRSVCVDQYRKIENRMTFIGLEFEIPDSDVVVESLNVIKTTLDSSANLINRQTLYQVFRFLRRNFRTRDAHIMYMYAYGYKIVEICDELKLSESIVKSRIFRMREALDELNLTNYGRRITKNNHYAKLSTESQNC